jgi:hypothetical protein
MSSRDDPTMRVADEAHAKKWDAALRDLEARARQPRRMRPPSTEDVVLVLLVAWAVAAAGVIASCVTWLLRGCL